MLRHIKTSSTLAPPSLRNRQHNQVSYLNKSLTKKKVLFQFWNCYPMPPLTQNISLLTLNKTKKRQWGKKKKPSSN